MKKIFGIAFIFGLAALQLQARHDGRAYEVPARVPVYADTIFPTPVGQRNMLFYIQRTPNINTIIYALNVNEKNQLDTEEPVHVYWIRYGERGQTEELSYIQRRYAYGLKTKSLGNDKYELRFVSYKNLPFYLQRSPKDNQYHVYATVNKKEMILNRIYLQIEGGTFWFPEVKWVEVKGIDPATGREMTERFKP
jgi:hypothetical protein